MNYGQNRPSFHNGSHNMHSNHGPNNIANMSTTVTKSQQQAANINKMDTNCGIQSQSNVQQQQRYKPMDASSHTTQKPSIQMASNKENVHSVDRIDMNHGCVDDPGALSSIASSKTKTAMCIINELVRANQVCYTFTENYPIYCATDVTTYKSNEYISPIFI